MKSGRFFWLLSIAGPCLFIATQARAHCDTMDGPVVKDATAALAAGDVTGVLKWVRPEDEPEIGSLFDQVTAARAQGGPAKGLAERYFFESLVRIHRAGEGAPYTGLKPAGHVEPIIAASDEALDQGNVDRLIDRITRHIAEAIRQRFEKASETRRHAGHSVAAGRAYVAAYVEFTHYVEALHAAAAGTAHAHNEPGPEMSNHQTQESSHEQAHK
jgi:hypothetical protein